MKDNINKIDQDPKTVYWIVLEKLSIVLCLVIVFAGALALDLPWWAVGAILGFSRTYRIWSLLLHLHSPGTKKTGRLMRKESV